MSDANTYLQDGVEFRRKKEPRRVITSTLLSAFVAILAFLYPFIADLFAHKQDDQILHNEAKRALNYSQLSAPPPIELKRPEPETFKVAPKIKKIKFLQPVAKKDEDVPDNEDLPTMDEMEFVQVSDINQEGIDSVVFDMVEEVLPPEPEREEEIFSFVEKMPTFKGGESALMSYLKTNLEYPESAKEMGIEGTVMVQFHVLSNGDIADVEIVRGISIDLDKEAIRVIESMPDWNPGYQNDRPVKVSYVIPIRFLLRYSR